MRASTLQTQTLHRGTNGCISPGMSASSAAKTLDTPPTSDVEIAPRLPPSPPLSPKRRTSRSRVDRVLGFLRLRRAGYSSASSENHDWKVFKLTCAEFAGLEARLTADEGLRGCWEDQVRYDWEPREGRYVLRMPIRVHERFTACVERAISEGISQLADRLGESEDGKEVAAELRKITLGRSTTLELHAPPLENSSQESAHASTTQSPVIVRRSPDATFFHPAQDELPCLVVEVGYSQQRKDLPRLAESYIVDSEHAIRCVLTLDITYPTARGKKNGAGKQTATASVWRPAMETGFDGEEVGVCVCDSEEAFQDAEGTACGGSLSLRISDLLPTHILEDLPLPPPADAELTISFADLAAFLTTAQRTHTAPPSASSTTSAPKRFRKRKRTPCEELSDSREAKFVREELRAMEREGVVDKEWNVVRMGGLRGGDGDDEDIDGSARRRSLRRRTAGRGAEEGVGP